MKRHIADTNAASNVVICVSGVWDDDRLLLEYSAACLLEKRGNADNHFTEELQVYKNDRFKSIQEMIQTIYSPENPDTVFFSSERVFDNISTPIQFNRELSRVCENVYYAYFPLDTSVYSVYNIIVRRKSKDESHRN